MVIINHEDLSLGNMHGTAIDFGFRERDPDVPFNPTMSFGDGWITSSGWYFVKLDGPEGRVVEVKAEDGSMVKVKMASLKESTLKEYSLNDPLA